MERGIQGLSRPNCPGNDGLGSQPVLWTRPPRGGEQAPRKPPPAASTLRPPVSSDMLGDVEAPRMKLRQLGGLI